MSDSCWPPGVCSNSCPLSWWCYLTISSSTSIHLSIHLSIYPPIYLSNAYLALTMEDPMEEEMATHSSILSWKTPWTEKPAGLQCIGSQRVKHRWATKHICKDTALPRWHSGKESACQWGRRKRREFNPWSGRSPGVGNGNPLQYSCLGNPIDRGAWRATVHKVAKSRIRLSDWAHSHVRPFGYKDWVEYRLWSLDLGQEGKE